PLGHHVHPGAGGDPRGGDRPVRGGVDRGGALVLGALEPAERAGVLIAANSAQLTDDPAQIPPLSTARNGACARSIPSSCSLPLVLPPLRRPRRRPPAVPSPSRA